MKTPTRRSDSPHEAYGWCVINNKKKRITDVAKSAKEKEFWKWYKGKYLAWDEEKSTVSSVSDVLTARNKAISITLYFSTAKRSKRKWERKRAQLTNPLLYYLYIFSSVFLLLPFPHTHIYRYIMHTSSRLPFVKGKTSARTCVCLIALTFWVFVCVCVCCKKTKLQIDIAVSDCSTH